MRFVRSSRFGLHLTPPDKGSLLVSLVISFALIVPSGAGACVTALILALDVSSSVDQNEYDLQQTGLARALSDPEVGDAILSQGGIWLSVFEWSGANHQYNQIDWTFLDSPGAIEGVASQIAQMERRVDEFPTALGYALGHALIRLRSVPKPCFRHVVDVSGDGVNNAGFQPESAYRANDMRGVTINGLVIEGDDPPPLPYYRNKVMYGPGAFVETISGYQDYAEGMRRKLLRELRVIGLAQRE